MGDMNKDNNKKQCKKGDPAPHNDQIGENAGEGRFIKAQDNKKNK